MADLPSFQFAEAENQYPFLNVGIDFFGPFYIEHRNHKLKNQYVCLVTRATLGWIKSTKRQKLFCSK